MKAVRRFVRVEGRGVHYIRAGEGPPVVLLHYAEASASAPSLLPLIEILSADHTVFAFDHPGHGDTDPLEQDEIDAADLADALSATLAALGMPPCPIYGSHTGAAVALELGCRHPEQVTGLVLDGPVMFNATERAAYHQESFMPPLEVQDDGSHLYSAWVRMRDGIIWVPWNQRKPEFRFATVLPGPEEIHRLFMDMVRGGNTYQAVYRAGFSDGREAAAALTAPATFLASEADPCYEHLDRLPELKDNQEIVRRRTELDFFGDFEFHQVDAADIVRKYRTQADPPPDLSLRPTQGKVNRRYLDLPDGQILVRSAGEEREGRPLLLLHDGRGSSRMLEPLMHQFARQRPVYAPDLPDNGASDAHPAERPEIADYADSVAGAIKELGLDSPDVYALGASAGVALDLLSWPALRLGGVVLEAPDFYSASFASRLESDWVPPIAPAWDGAHINSLWLMLRDEYAWWPWFDKTTDAVCAVGAPTDWSETHARVVEILRSLPTYHRLTMAALRYDWLSGLRGVGDQQVSLAVTAPDPSRPHVEAAAKEAEMADASIFPDRISDRASGVLELLDR